jgi:hypothetical protein
MACTKVKDLAPGLETTAAFTKADGGVAQSLEAEFVHHGGDEQQAGVGHQVWIIEGHGNPVHSARYWLHKKCLLCL